MAGGWDESGCAYPRRSRRLNTSIELRRVTKAHGDMRVGDEKSAEVIVPVRGRTESWQASATAGCRKSSIGKSTQHRLHGGCRAASSAERKGRVGALIDKRTAEDSDTNTTRGTLPGNRRVSNGTNGGVRGRLPPRRGQPPTRLTDESPNGRTHCFLLQVSQSTQHFTIYARTLVFPISGFGLWHGT